jgi:16S rRNA C967 or C1407 C5-methylase (RsmB/RsmF family)
VVWKIMDNAKELRLCCFFADAEEVLYSVCSVELNENENKFLLVVSLKEECLCKLIWNLRCHQKSNILARTATNTLL